MFNVEKSHSGTYEIITLRNGLTGESASVIPTLGACLYKLILSNKEKKYSVLNSCESIDQFSTSYLHEYNGAKLFPYPNRVKNGKYTFEGSDFELNQNDAPPYKHALHGILYNQVFAEKEIIEGNDFCAVILQYTNLNNTSFAGYPFSFELSIKYSLSNKGLKATTLVTNLGYSAMPFGDGWHPYFTMGGVVDDLYLLIPSDRVLELGDDLIPTGRLTKYQGFSSLNRISDSILNHSFRIETEAEIVETVLYNSIDDFKLVLWQENSFDKYKYVQVYIPPDRQSIAIEPMTCAPDAFNNTMGLHIIQPGQQYSCRFGIKLVD